VTSGQPEFVVDRLHGRPERFLIGEWFPHPHDNHVRQSPFLESGCVFRASDLLDEFCRAEMT
jgi:hypothetical protein